MQASYKEKRRVENVFRKKLPVDNASIVSSVKSNSFRALRVKVTVKQAQPESLSPNKNTQIAINASNEPRRSKRNRTMYTDSKNSIVSCPDTLAAPKRKINSICSNPANRHNTWTQNHKIHSEEIKNQISNAIKVNTSTRIWKLE